MFDLYVAIFLEAEYSRRAIDKLTLYSGYHLSRPRWITMMLGVNPWSGNGY